MRWLAIYAVLVGLFLIAGSLAGLASLTPGHGKATHHGTIKTPALMIPFGRPHFGVASSNNPYYLQEGASIAEMNNPSEAFTAWAMTLTLQNSPYSTGYEFNGLTNTGDWYQTVVGDNWPSCPGFVMGWEYWNNGGKSVGQGCDLSIPLSAGQMVALGLQVSTSGSTSGDVCMYVENLFTGAKATDCESQPDPGSSPASNYFVMMGSPANNNGYFTGPMTEVVDLSATSCTYYRAIPTITYAWPSQSYISEYIPWSDEFQLGGSTCYGYASPTITQAQDDYTIHPIDVSIADGPHWEAAQNLSSGGGPYSWQISTDYGDPTVATPTATPNSVDLTQSTTFSVSPWDGSGNYSYVWSGFPAGCVSSNVASIKCAPTGTGNFQVSVTVTDTSWGYVVTTGALSFTVYGDPSIALPTATHSSVDIGQSVTFSATSSGGSGSNTFTWIDLPSGCTGTGASVTCKPTAAAANTPITVKVIDSNGMSATSTSLLFKVYTDPTAYIAPSSVSINYGDSLTLSAGENGGAGPSTYAWSGLPPSCASSSSGVSCTPSQEGSFSVSITIIDQNGYSSKAYLNMTVAGFMGLNVNPTAGLVVTVGVVALMIAVVIVLLAARKRKNERSSSDKCDACGERIPPYAWSCPECGAPVPGGNERVYEGHMPPPSSHETGSYVPPTPQDVYPSPPASVTLPAHQELMHAPTERVYCTSCGEANTVDSRFCRFCGSKVSD